MIDISELGFHDAEVVSAKVESDDIHLGFDRVGHLSAGEGGINIDVTFRGVTDFRIFGDTADLSEIEKERDYVLSLEVKDGHAVHILMDRDGMLGEYAACMVYEFSAADIIVSVRS